MPLAFFISKSWEGQSRALTPAVQIATFDDSTDLLETLLWHFLQKLLRFMVLLSTAPKLLIYWASMAGEHYRRKHRTA